MKDEIVDEVRAIRQAYAARFNFDIKAMCEDLKAKERMHPERIAKLQPVEPKPEKTHSS